MKKSLLTIITLIIICGCASTKSQTISQTVMESNNLIIQNEINHPSIHFVKDGEYVFYLDKRYDEIIYRGYMKFTSADNQVGIIVRNIFSDSGVREVFIFVVDDDEDGFPTVIKDVRGRFSQIGFQAILDFQNFTSLYLRTQNEYEMQSIIYDDWGNFRLVFSFDKTLPFFKFSDVKVEGNDEILYSFLSGGVFNRITFEGFMEIDPSGENNN